MRAIDLSESCSYDLRCCQNIKLHKERLDMDDNSQGHLKPVFQHFPTIS